MSQPKPSSNVLSIAAASLMLLTAMGCGDARAPGSRTSRDTPASPDPSVTAVRGASWLRHLGLRVDQTRMGEMGGESQPPPSARTEPQLGTPGTGSMSGGEGGGMMGGGGRDGMGMGPGMMGGGVGGVMHRFLGRYRSDRKSATALLGEAFELTGADLYRLNCQSCHGPKGEGAPPEIKSLLDPVRGATVSAIEARMKKAGHPIAETMAKQLAAQGEATLRKRLADGGKKMPAFAHLRGDEVDALLAYLRHLAGVTGPEAEPLLVPQTAARVGEHLVKGTCHICHDAVGPGGHRAMMEGVIPSLGSFPQDQSLTGVVRQVEYGSGPMMRMMGGPAMPALPYITPEEVAAAYFYLEAYPPGS